MLKASSYATGVARRDRAAIAAAQPPGRWGTTADTARLVAWSVSDEADWVTGRVVALDGGWSSRECGLAVSETSRRGRSCTVRGRDMANRESPAPAGLFVG